MITYIRIITSLMLQLVKVIYKHTFFHLVCVTRMLSDPRGVCVAVHLGESERVREIEGEREVERERERGRESV